MFSAAVFAAGVTFPVGMVVVVAVNIGVKGQPSPQKVLHCLVGAAGDSTKYGDPRLGQGIFGAAPDAAADEGRYLLLCQQSHQGRCGRCLRFPAGAFPSHGRFPGCRA